MTQIRLRSPRGFTLGELLAILAMVAITAAILFPIFARSPRHARMSICASNMKQVGPGLVGYTGDNDEKFLPATGVIRLSDGKVYEQQWGITTKATISGKEVHVPSIIDGYMSQKRVFQCRLVKVTSSGLTYLYNDLAANESQGSMSGVANSVLIAGGDDHLRNTGHARSWSHQGAEAVFLPSQNGVAPKLLIGAAIGAASIRHQGGTNYGFADGHVKWMKPETVFFPPRTSNSSSHREAKTGRLLGPAPAGATKTA